MRSTSRFLFLLRIHFWSADDKNSFNFSLGKVKTTSLQIHVYAVCGRPIAKKVNESGIRNGLQDSNNITNISNKSG